MVRADLENHVKGTHHVTKFEEAWAIKESRPGTRLQVHCTNTRRVWILVHEAMLQIQSTLFLACYKFTDTFPGLEIDCIAHNFLAMTTLLIENGCPRQRYGFSIELIIRQVCNTCTHFS